MDNTTNGMNFEHDNGVKRLVSMGFRESKAEEAITLSLGDVEASLNRLLLSSTTREQSSNSSLLSTSNHHHHHEAFADSQEEENEVSSSSSTTTTTTNNNNTASKKPVVSSSSSSRSSFIRGGEVGRGGLLLSEIIDEEANDLHHQIDDLTIMDSDNFEKWLKANQHKLQQESNDNNNNNTTCGNNLLPLAEEEEESPLPLLKNEIPLPRMSDLMTSWRFDEWLKTNQLQFNSVKSILEAGGEKEEQGTTENETNHLRRLSSEQQQQQQQQSNSHHNNESKPSSDSSTSPSRLTTMDIQTSPPRRRSDEQQQQDHIISTLVSMGFEKNHAIQALNASKFDIDMAVRDLLLLSSSSSSSSATAAAAPPAPEEPKPTTSEDNIQLPSSSENNRCSTYQHWMLRLNDQHGYRIRETLRMAPDEMLSDKRFMITAVTKIGDLLQYASDDLLNDIDVVISAVQNQGTAIRFASKSKQYNLSVVLEAVRNDGFALKYIPTEYQNNRNIVLEAVSSRGMALKYAPDQLKRNDNDVVMMAVKQDWRALQFALDDAAKNMDIVLVAMKQDPNAIRYVHEDINRDPKVLIAAGMIDDHNDEEEGCASGGGMTTTRHHKPTRRLTKIVLSTRFSLNLKSQSEATNFTKLLKESNYIRDGYFKIYAPNAFNKQSCDPNWTDFNWPCRGTKETCTKINKEAIDNTGRVNDNCCWRYSFRCQLLDAKKTGGFMIQVVEKDSSSSFGGCSFQSLGDGQKIERDMAQQIQLKMFHVYRPMVGNNLYEESFQNQHINNVIEKIHDWYKDGCQDMSDCIIRFP